MSFKECTPPQEIPFYENDLNEKQIQYTAEVSLYDLHRTLKTHCKEVYDKEYISIDILAKVRLTLDMIEDKLGISTYDERMELIKKL
jgi:hypothetical protein